LRRRNAVWGFKSSRQAFGGDLGAVAAFGHPPLGLASANIVNDILGVTRIMQKIRAARKSRLAELLDGSLLAVSLKPRAEFRSSSRLRRTIHGDKTRLSQ
jgi:hypothetical protein